MMKSFHRSAGFFVLFAFIGAACFAQDASLKAGSKKPEVDGVIAAGEYAFQKDLGKAVLYLSRTDSTIYIGFTGNTTGWVSVGLGPGKMDGSTIFMGFVADGKTVFKPQVGIGHKHSDAENKEIADSVVSYAMKEDGGKTTLELALKSATYIADGQQALDIIYALAAADSSPIHSFRGSQEVTLE